MAQTNGMDSSSCFVWLDAIHYKFKDKGRYKSKAVHTVLAVNLEGKKGRKGKKEILGLYLSEVWPKFM